MLNVKTPEEVFRLIEEAFQPLEKVNTVSLDFALGEVLAEDITAEEYVPDFDRSTVDGYALRAADTFGCSDSLPAILNLAGEVKMGEGEEIPVPRDACVYVPTGGRIPADCDCAVMLEYTEDYGDGTVGIFKAAAPGQNLIFRGDDVRPGKLLLRAGHVLRARDVGALVVIGSHDPLLDELADLIHRQDRSLYLSSSHVGSMGGVMAVRRGEAHAAGVHLLDAETGSYNLAVIRKNFPKGGVVLLRCVGRVQGLMLQKGNPLGIRGFRDIAREGVRYVNRQKGSGTRLLMDYLCGSEGILPEQVRGYEREELTHNAVAVQIAENSADAGLGIYSTAKLYDLDFIPVCEEEYDLLIPASVRDSEPVRALVRTLKSPEFRERIEAMGGYTLDRPGEEIRLYGE